MWRKYRTEGTLLAAAVMLVLYGCYHFDTAARCLFADADKLFDRCQCCLTV